MSMIWFTYAFPAPIVPAISMSNTGNLMIWIVTQLSKYQWRACYMHCQVQTDPAWVLIGKACMKELVVQCCVQLIFFFLPQQVKRQYYRNLDMRLLSHMRLACVKPSWGKDIHANICAQGTNPINCFPIGVTGPEPQHSLILLLFLLYVLTYHFKPVFLNLFTGYKHPE